GDDPSKVGIPAGYRWGYILAPDGDDATVVTEVFDYGPLPEDLLRDGGAWINGTNSVLESMTASLERLAKISTQEEHFPSESMNRSSERSSRQAPCPITPDMRVLGLWVVQRSSLSERGDGPQ